MPELTEKEALIARRQVITNLAHQWQDQLLQIENADLGMAVDAACMIIIGASKQCPSPDVRLNLLNALNETIQQCAAMNHTVVAPPAPDPGSVQLLN